MVVVDISTLHGLIRTLAGEIPLAASHAHPVSVTGIAISCRATTTTRGVTCARATSRRHHGIATTSIGIDRNHGDTRSTSIDTDRHRSTSIDIGATSTAMLPPPSTDAIPCDLDVLSDMPMNDYIAGAKI